MCGLDGALFAVEAVGMGGVGCVLVECGLFIVFIAQTGQAADVAILVLVLAACVFILFVFIRAFQDLQPVRYLRFIVGFVVSN